MKPTYQEYQPKSILNVHKHVDGWFFDKYSAHPYMGCAFGCEFCYSRDQRYLGGRDPEAFSRVIRVKTNADELLRRELARRPVDVIACGDWQVPAERDHGLSRRMLQVVLELGFPLLVVERSPFVTRDLDLLAEINRQAWACVIFSVSSLDAAVKRAFEPRSPAVSSRFRAMEQIAAAGILTGTALMPILPAVCDDDAHLEQVVAATAHHGGRFVLAGGLTMSGHQAGLVMRVVERDFPAALPAYQAFYGAGAYGPPAAYNAGLGRRVREMCGRHGLADRLPRWLGHGPPGRQPPGGGRALRPRLRTGVGGGRAPAHLGLPAGCMEHRRVGAGREPGLQSDGAQGAGEHRARGTAAGRVGREPS